MASLPLPDPNVPPVRRDTGTIDANTPPSTFVREGGQTHQPDVPNSPDPWSDREAVRIVCADFDRAAAYRQTNHETRWQEASEKYLAWRTRRRFWEGSKIPMADMQVFLIFQQVEALLPQMVDALTGNDLDFDVEAARSGTTIAQCHLVRDVVTSQLRSLGGSHTRFLGWREVVRRMAKDGLIFGNGIAEWGWEGPYQVPQQRWERQQFPEYGMMTHPMFPGMGINVPTGRMLSRAVPVQSQKTISQFWLDPCALMDFYIDPNTRGPNVQEAEFAIRRKLMTVAELSAYRGQEGWNIPDDTELLRLARKKQWTQGDTTRQAMATARGENLQPMDDHSVDPRLAKVEVLRYFQRDRHVWLLAREHVAWNTPNRYGALPFTNWTYVDVPNAFYGMSIPDIAGTDQNLAKTLIDGRLNELNLALHPPILTKLGASRSSTQMKFRPGANWEVQDPSKDVVRLEMGNITQNAFVEVDALERRVQKNTGVTDLSMMGVAASGGNSANRTATGVQAQTAASNSRVHYLVANFEDQTAGPILETIWQLLREFMDPQTLMDIVGPDGKMLQVDPVDLLNSDPRFVMKTAQRMKQRAGLQGGGLNIIMQYLMNAEVMDLMSEQQGKTMDIESLSEVVCDTFNLRAFNFFRPMTPQEQQALAARKQQGGQEKMALQTARLQAMSADAHERDETKVIVAALGALAQAGMLNKAVDLPVPIELEAKRLEAEIKGGQYDAQPAGAE